MSDFGQAAHDKFVGAAQSVGELIDECFPLAFNLCNLRLSLFLGQGFENMKDGAEQWFANAGDRVKNWWNDAGEKSTCFS